MATNVFPESGKVGIGTTEPKAELDIVKSSTAWGRVKLKIGGYRGSEIQFWQGNDRVGAITATHQDVSGKYHGLDIHTYGCMYYIKLAGILTVKGQTKVGIGTEEPTELLEVNGNILANGSIKIKDWELAVPDEVFKEDYDLMDLNKLEKYVKKNNRLPEFPSAKKAKKEGINLNELSMNLLKKVEELTLHVIRQNKRINKLEAKLATK